MEIGFDPRSTARQEFRLPVSPRLVIRKVNHPSMVLTEVRGPGGRGLTTAIPPDDAYLVQLRLIDCPGIEYFSEGRHLDGVDRGAGVIQFHDLRRDPVAVLPDPFHVLHFHLPISVINAVVEQMHAPSIDRLELAPSQGVRDPLMRNLFHSLLPLLDCPEHAHSLVVDHVGLALTAHIAQTYGGVRDRSKIKIGGLTGAQERRIRELLDASIASDVSLTRLALECGLSTRHFARAFQQSLGTPPHRYLLKLRVERARELLEGSSKTLLEVALECGFSDQSHFTRVFRASTGTTPGAWRRNRSALRIYAK